MLNVFEKPNFCLQCGKEVPSDRKFCSKNCKSISQIKRVALICFGCEKRFSILPCLKRKTNYCSTNCYRNSTRLKQRRICKKCRRNFWADNSLIQKGFGLYCNKKCQFDDYPERITKTCMKCDKEIKVQPSKVRIVKFCSKKCSDDFKRDYVSKICRHCKKRFELPRSDLDRGRGNFCRYRCYLTYRGPSLLEEKVEKALGLAKISFEREVKFKKFHVDFLLPKFMVVIECDGEYWHMSQKAKERDKRKDELLSRFGYKVIRLSGQFINKNSEKQLMGYMKQVCY